MTLKEIEAKAKELKELERMQDELTAEIETMRDAIKASLTERNTDTLIAGGYKITWKTVTSSRFDSTAFKKAQPELAAQYTKESTTKRFLIN
jgi:predicted phage-related endonuclease